VKPFVIATIVAGLGLASTLAVAGRRSTSDIRIDGISARGSMGSVRGNPTTTDFIGCSVNTQSGPLRIECFAQQGTVSARCFSDDPAQIAVGTALADSTFLWFAPNRQTGECDWIDAYNSSEHQPRQP
jgi:hypothetical protein